MGASHETRVENMCATGDHHWNEYFIAYQPAQFVERDCLVFAEEVHLSRFLSNNCHSISRRKPDGALSGALEYRQICVFLRI